MSDYVNCPYCKNSTFVDLDDINVLAEEPFTTECEHCGKVILVTPSVHITLDADKCQCQGQDHEWEPTQTFPKCFSKMICKHCGEEREPTEEERTKYKLGRKEDYLHSLNK